MGTITGKYSSLGVFGGVAVQDPYQINTSNPASYSNVSSATHVFETGGQYQSIKTSTLDASEQNKKGMFNGLNFLFRTSKASSAVVGLTPFSTVDYAITSVKDVAGESTSFAYNGTGGFNKFFIGTSWTIANNLSLGAHLSYLFGSLKREETLLSGQAAGLAIHQRLSARKIILDYGIQYRLKIGDRHSASVGLVYNMKEVMTAKNHFAVLNLKQGVPDTLIAKAEKKTFTTPESIGLGLATTLGQFAISSDLSFTKWADVGPGYTNALRGRLSFQYYGKRNPESYLDMISVRAGFSVEENYLVIRQTQFLTSCASAAIGFPVARNSGSLILSYSMLKNGTTDNGLIYERAHGISIDLVFRDLWGIKRKFD
ncbi:MAG TPA: hypothetical protein VGD40_02345 [Chryseosolibacter sp.]